VVRILHDPAGSGSTHPGVQVLQVGECSANSALSRTHCPLQSPPVLRGAVAEPGSDALSHALHRTSIEGLKDPLGDTELPQLSVVGKALLHLPHQSVNVCCQQHSHIPPLLTVKMREGALLPGRQHRLWICLASRRTAAGPWREVRRRS